MREFWIELTEFLPMIGDENGNLVPNGKAYLAVSTNTRMNFISNNEIPNSLHVIEYSAYESAIAERDELKKSIQSNRDMEIVDVLQLTQERDRYKAAGQALAEVLEHAVEMGQYTLGGSTERWAKDELENWNNIVSPITTDRQESVK